MKQLLLPKIYINQNEIKDSRRPLKKNNKFE